MNNKRKATFLAILAGGLLTTGLLLLFDKPEQISPVTDPPSPPLKPAQTRATQPILTDSEPDAIVAGAVEKQIPTPSYLRQLAEFKKEEKTVGYRILREDETGLTLEISIPEYRLETVSAEGRPAQYQQVTIPGYLTLEEPGRPLIPVTAITIPLPGVESVEVSAETNLPVESGGEVILADAPSDRQNRREIERIWTEKTLADGRLLEVLPDRWRTFAEERRKALETEENVLDEGTGSTDVGDKSDALYPPQVVESSGPLWAGDEQFVNLRITPVQYSRSTGKLVSCDRVTIDVKYGAPIKTLPKGDQPDYGAQFALANSDAFKASVWRDGVHTITYQNLVDAGFNVGQDPRALRMYFMGQEISIYIYGQEDGSWDPGDYLDFYGQKNTGFYSQTNVYWLYQTSGTGSRMSEVSSPLCGRPSRQEHFLDALHLEKRVSYQPFLPVGANNDYWFWDYAGYTYGLDYPATITFTLAGVSDWEGTASFTGRYFGYTTYDAYNPDHHTRVYLNGLLLGDFTWDGQVSYTLQTDIPQSAFNEGTNTILTQEVNDLGLPITGEFIFIDNFDLTYYRDYESSADWLTFTASGKADYRIGGFSGDDLALYDITNTDAPQRITDFTVQTDGVNTLVFRKWDAVTKRYCAFCRTSSLTPTLTQNTPSDLPSPRVIDYIIITHPNFTAAIQPLAAFREETAHGDFRVETFEVQDIYNTFGFGNFTPYAIKYFLQYAYTDWDALTHPQYALLVGDGNYDYQNYLGLSLTNYVPPYMFHSQYMETASDNWYVSFIGEDRIPDMNIGRLCVTSFSETTQQAGRIIGYENGTDGLSWQDNILMVADNPDPAAGDFPADSNWLIANYIPPSFTAQTAYVPNLGVAGTRNAIINGCNSGKLLVNYMGHGATNTWSSPTIFSTTNIASLTNADRLNLLITPTCLNGYWCDTAGDCLAEAMTLTPKKGSIAAVSPSGLSLNTPARQLTGFLFQELLTNYYPCGPALTRAKIRLAAITPYLYMLDIYTLFGDPALPLK